MAAYRFFDNDSVDWQDFMAPHWQQTQQRMAIRPVILCLEDTTELDFIGQETKSLGPLSYEAQRDMFLHLTYAVTPGREPPGIRDAWMWARTLKDADGQRGGQKESLHWINGYERIAEMAPDLPETRLVYVADREADLMPLMARAQELGTPADWLVRAKHNRCLPNGDRLWAHTTEGAPLSEISFLMPARKGTKARTVRQQLWARRVELPASKGKTVIATFVVAREIGAPSGAMPVEWRFLTNLTVETDIAAAALIDWYRARWEIEMLCDVLKNACRGDALQLGSIEKPERALALFVFVAWRIAYLMRSGRTCPDLDATLFFDPDEIHSAYLLNDQDAPDKPKFNDVLRLVARLGGFLGRKSDGEHGVKTIWLGMKEIHVAAKTMGKLRDQTFQGRMYK